MLRRGGAPLTDVSAFHCPQRHQQANPPPWADVGYSRAAPWPHYRLGPATMPTVKRGGWPGGGRGSVLPLG